MAIRARSIVKVNIDDLITKLSSALASEYQAWVQYIASAALVRGVIARSAKAEFEDHAEKELEHAAMLVERIIQLNGRPVTMPSDWAKLHKELPFGTANDVMTLLNLNIEGEQDAISTYSEIFNMTEGIKDPVTNMMVQQILSDECEHEQDLTILVEDFQE